MIYFEDVNHFGKISTILKNIDYFEKILIILKKYLFQKNINHSKNYQLYKDFARTLREL